MEQYISKSAVVEELERLYNLEYTNTSNLSCGKKIMLRNILHFLDILEVKEFQKKKLYVVTRCEEHSDYVEEAFFSEKKAEEYCKQFEGNEDAYGRDITEIEVDCPLEVKEVNLEKEIIRVSKNEYFDFTDWKSIARHFFELGLQVNNPITAADRGMAEEIIINLKRVEQDYHLDLTREMEWLRKKTHKL